MHYKNKIKYRNYNIFLITALTMLFSTLTKEEILLRKINLNFEITLTINGSGYQKIFSDYYDLSNAPNQILINNNAENLLQNQIYLKENINNVTIIWSDFNMNANMMFYKLANITNFDFSKFDTSNINNMSYMFFGC